MSRYFELMQSSERDSQARRRGEQVPSPAGDPSASGFSWAGTNHALASVPRPGLLQPQSPSRVSFLRFLAEGCFRRPRSFLAIAGITLLITVLAIFLTPRRYQATMQLVFLNKTESDVNAQAELLRSRDVLSQALEQMGTPAFARDQALHALERRLQVARVRSSPILNLSYAGSSPERASDVLRAVVSSFVSRELALLGPTRQQLLAELVERRQRELTEAQQQVAAAIASLGETSDVNDRLQERVAGAQRNLDLAAQQRDQAAVDEALEKDRIRNIALAAKPSASSIPVQPRSLLYLASGLCSAMLLAISFCVFAELKRCTVCSPAELDALTGLSTLATLPWQKFERRK